MILIFPLIFVPITYAKKVDGYKYYKFGMTFQEIIKVAKEKGNTCNGMMNIPINLDHDWNSSFGYYEKGAFNLFHDSFSCKIGKYETSFKFDHHKKHNKSHYLDEEESWTRFTDLISGLSPLTELKVNFGKFNNTFFIKLHNAMSKKYGLISEFSESERNDFNKGLSRNVKNFYADKTLSLGIYRLETSEYTREYTIFGSYLSKEEKNVDTDDDI